MKLYCYNGWWCIAPNEAAARWAYMVGAYFVEEIK